MGKHLSVPRPMSLRPSPLPYTAMPGYTGWLPRIGVRTMVRKQSS
jgi:hypothetical protein